MPQAWCSRKLTDGVKFGIHLYPLPWPRQASNGTNFGEIMHLIRLSNANASLLISV